MTTDAKMVASHRRAIQRRGHNVKFRRVVTGTPAQVTDAVVKAIVMKATPDPTASLRQGRSDREVGGLRQFDRQIVVMAEDLQQKGFPLPLKLGDAVFLDPDADKGKLEVSQVDNETRALAGAIELLAAGT